MIGTEYSIVTESAFEPVNEFLYVNGPFNKARGDSDDFWQPQISFVHKPSGAKIIAGQAIHSSFREKLEMYKLSLEPSELIENPFLMLTSNPVEIMKDGGSQVYDLDNIGRRKDIIVSSMKGLARYLTNKISPAQPTKMYEVTTFDDGTRKVEVIR
ncbi:MAG: hypothetical protein KC506_01590 [Nanoarchaeota archaeon]|nr:hypothetical protein [Nanoarchaeota archaeon]